MLVLLCYNYFASLQLSRLDDLLTFLRSCCRVIVPSTNMLVFHFPLKREGRRWKAQFSPQPGVSTQQCPVSGFTSAQALNLFLRWLYFCHRVATWHTLSLGDSAP